MTADRNAPSVHSYCDEWRDACLALFDGNTPDFFAVAERAQYAAFLDQPGATYLVMRMENEGVVAAGGYYMTEEDSLGALAWGIVARRWHRHGLGSELLRLRLSRLAASGARAVRVRTSQHSRGFFERFGFRPTSVIPDGFSPDIDLVELRLQLQRA